MGSVALDPAQLFEAGAAPSLGYVGSRLASPDREAVRGGYAVLAQLMFTIAALREAFPWDADLHARTALAVFTLAAGQGLRIGFSRKGTIFGPRDCSGRWAGAPEYGWP